MSEVEAVEVETLSERVARRLRGALAESMISRTDLAQVLHVPQQKISRKVLGQTPFTINEMELLANVFGIDVSELMGVGEHENRPLRRLSLSKGADLYAMRDLNPQPADSGFSSLGCMAAATRFADVISLAGRQRHHPGRGDRAAGVVLPFRLRSA